MLKSLGWLVASVFFVSVVAHDAASARGFGGFHGGGGFRGGGMGGFRGGGIATPNFGGGRNLEHFQTGRINPQRFSSRAGSGLSSWRPGQARLGGGGINGLRGAGGDGRVTRSSLNQFLGLPSDSGLHALSGQTQSRGSQLYDNIRSGNRPSQNFISGETQSRGSQLYDNIRSGNRPSQNFISGETQSRGSQLYDSIKSGNRPFQNFIPGETQSLGSRIYDQIKAGNRPFQNFIPGETQSLSSRIYDRYRAHNHPLHPWGPWYIHNHAIIIRRNFNNYYIFTPGWYRRYPGAWYPPAWYYGDAWAIATWAALASYEGYDSADPVYYNYGDNVVYQDNSVYVNGQDVGTAAQYYDQAQNLASAGSETADSKDAQWMSLGVFAASQQNQTSASVLFQLAVNRQGTIRGNYTNTTTKQVSPIEGSVDKKTQRAAWVVGKNKDTVYETGLYNLTKDESPLLVHLGKDRTEQWLLVRLKQQDKTNAAPSGGQRQQ